MSGIRAKNGLEGECIMGYPLPHYFLISLIRVGVYGSCKSLSGKIHSACGLGLNRYSEVYSACFLFFAVWGGSRA